MGGVGRVGRVGGVRWGGSVVECVYRLSFISPGDFISCGVSGVVQADLEVIGGDVVGRLACEGGGVG